MNYINAPQCQQCGRFFSWKDVETHKARYEMVTPDSDVSHESWDILCKECNA